MKIEGGDGRWKMDMKTTVKLNEVEVEIGVIGDVTIHLANQLGHQMKFWFGLITPKGGQALRVRP